MIDLSLHVFSVEALDALTRERMQEELLTLWSDVRLTLLFVTHSIPEAIRIGTRILLLSAHPAQVKAELNCPGHDAADDEGRRLSDKIQHILAA